MPPLAWDIFCKVIDNHGDIGVCWRLSSQLAQRGHRVRLWVDDASALAWMAPGRPDGTTRRTLGVQVLPWQAGVSPAPDTVPGDVVIEAFGCEPDAGFVAAMAREPIAPAWVNLEYLSAEPWVERNHGLVSPVMEGPGAGLRKRFFYPGFTPATGGLLREDDLLARQEAFDRLTWLQTHGLAAQQTARLVSLFCYEPPALDDWLAQLAAPADTHLLVTPGRASAAVQAVFDAAPAAPRPAVTWLPAVPQPGFDEMLWACDLNFVRGEDSLVRALWAGVPFVWHIYPQDDGAHAPKLEAFLDWLDAPASLRAFSSAWNGLAGAKLPADALAAGTQADWRACIQSARARLLAHADLCTQLETFVCH